MSMLPVKNIQGDTVGELEVADGILVFDKGKQAVHEAIVAYQANQRAGTAHTKGKGEVAGTGGKPWKQKGTGRARAGYQQSPVWRGGSVAMGPRTRSFETRLPKKVGRLAFRRAFSEKISAGEVTVVEDLDFSAPKTRDMEACLRALGLATGAVVVLDEKRDNVMLSARNIPDVQVTTAHHLNVYELLRFPSVLVTRKAMSVLEKRLQGTVGRKA